MDNTCPICGETVPLDRPGFTDEWHLMTHVVENHLAIDNRRIPNYQCWCGSVYPFWEMHDHVESRGGMVAHYLEFQLGVRHG